MSRSRSVTIKGRNYSSWSAYVRSLRGRFASLSYKKQLRALHSPNNKVIHIQRVEVKTEKKVIGKGFTQTTNEVEKIKTIYPEQISKDKIALKTKTDTYRINTVAHEDPETGSIWSTEIEEASRYTPAELHYEYEDLGGGVVEIKGIKNGRVVTATTTNDIPQIEKEVQKKTLQDEFEDWQTKSGKRLSIAKLQVLGKELGVDVGGGRLRHPQATFEKRIKKKLAEQQQGSRSTEETEAYYTLAHRNVKTKAPKYSNEEEINKLILESYSGNVSKKVKHKRPEIDQMEILLGAKKVRPDKNYNANQLAMGIKVEHEHTKNNKVAKIIAKDHLDEDPNYYTKLKKVEGH